MLISGAYGLRYGQRASQQHFSPKLNSPTWHRVGGALWKLLVPSMTGCLGMAENRPGHTLPGGRQPPTPTIAGAFLSPLGEGRNEERCHMLEAST